MKKIYILILFITIGNTLISCYSNAETQIATRYTIDEISNNPNFYWYKNEYNAYKCDMDILDSIKTLFNENVLKIIIYTSPSCGCGSSSLNTSFPKLIKILDSANLSNYEIYVVLKADGNEQIVEHPYSFLFQIKTLPAIYLLKSEQTYYNLLLQVTTKEISIEQALLDGIKFLDE